MVRAEIQKVSLLTVLKWDTIFNTSQRRRNQKLAWGTANGMSVTQAIRDWKCLTRSPSWVQEIVCDMRFEHCLRSATRWALRNCFTLQKTVLKTQRIVREGSKEALENVDDNRKAVCVKKVHRSHTYKYTKLVGIILKSRKRRQKKCVRFLKAFL